MNLYSYGRPVICVELNWKTPAYAISENKARNNFTYQYKILSDGMQNAKISLLEQIVIVQ